MQQSTNVLDTQVRKRMYQFILPKLLETIGSICGFFEKKKSQQQHINVRRPVACTAECLGLFTSTVLQVTKKLDTGESFPNANIHERKMSVPEEFISIIWKTIFTMYKAKEHVTIDTILGKLQANKEGRKKHAKWIWSRTTLYNFLVKKCILFTRKRKIIKKV